MSDSPSSSLTERQQFWLRHLKACEAAGMAMRVPPNFVP
jgi:hypothetical protein